MLPTPRAASAQELKQSPPGTAARALEFYSNKLRPPYMGGLFTLKQPSPMIMALALLRAQLVDWDKPPHRVKHHRCIVATRHG